MLQAAITVFFIFSLYTGAHAEDPFNYGAIWRAWPPVAQDAYLQGFTDGINAAYWKARNSWLDSAILQEKPEPETVKRVREAVYPFFSPAALSQMVSMLYQDPANTFIPWESMTYIARDKLKGKEIDEALKAARKKAVEDHILIQQMEQK